MLLREGRSRWIPAVQPKDPEYRDDWDGWGFRHIRAKHGWGQQDEDETRTTLLTPQVPRVAEGGWRYEAALPTPGQGGVSCRRVVVVDFVPGSTDPAARGIVTSYNEVAP